jgi:hypothetical protein
VIKGSSAIMFRAADADTLREMRFYGKNDKRHFGSPGRGMNLRIEAPPRVRSSRGQSLVEFAIILPVIMLIVLGIIDFGRAYNYKNDVTSLANQAVRYAEVNDCPACGGTLIQNYVPTTADSPELRNGGTGLGINQPVRICFYLPSGTSAGSPITAVATTTYQWMPSLGLGISPVTIRSEATGRLESNYDPSKYTATQASSCTP